MKTNLLPQITTRSTGLKFAASTIISTIWLSYNQCNLNLFYGCANGMDTSR